MNIPEFKTLIIGAGVSGMTIAHGLYGEDNLVLFEKEDHAGGLSTMYKSSNYKFDYAGHYFHFQANTRIKPFLEQFASFRSFKRKSRTFLLGKYIPFPIQFHLSHLPASIKNRIFEEMKEEKKEIKEFENLNDFLLFHFGETLYHLFFKPFQEKYYLLGLQELAANMDKGSIPVPDRNQVVEGMKGKIFTGAGYNATIYYPRGGLDSFINKMASPLNDIIHYNEEVMAIDSVKKEVITSKGIYKYERLISTMPLNHLLRILTPCDKFPSPQELQYRSTLLVNVVLERKRRRFHWAYLAESEFPFYRVGIYAAHSLPSCYLERNILPGSKFNADELKQEVEFTLGKLGLIVKASEIKHLDAKIIPVSYVVFDKKWRQIVPSCLEKLKELDIYSIGRYGTWNYSSMGNDIHDAFHLIERFRGKSPL